MNKDIFEENDRNIRVFGLETQKKLFESEVLIMNVTPMTSELCKNLILSGAGLCLFDNGSKVEESDSLKNFFYNKNDSGKNKSALLKEKIETFKKNCRITIITQINEIKSRKIKYGVMDLSQDAFSEEIKAEVEKNMIENNAILYYIKIENDKAIFLNNILEKKFMIENKNSDGNRFVKDENIIDYMDLSDDEGSTNDNNKENKENKPNEDKNNKVINISNNDETEKEEKILKENEYSFLNIEEKIKNIKDLIPKNMKKSEEEVINDAFRVINNNLNNKDNPLNCLVNYIIGGVVCHEIINCISKKKNPRTNIYYYDAFSGNGKFLNELYDKVLK